MEMIKAMLCGWNSVDEAVWMMDDGEEAGGVEVYNTMEGMRGNVRSVQSVLASLYDEI